MDPKPEIRNPKPELYRGGPTREEMLAGGLDVELEVLHRRLGAVEFRQARVRMLPVAEYPALRAALVDEDRLAVMYVAWGDTSPHDGLTPDAHEYVIEEGRRLNAHFFACWLPRREALEGQMRNPVLDTFLAGAARELAARLTASGPTSSDAPPAGDAPSPKSAR